MSYLCFVCFFPLRAEQDCGRILAKSKFKCKNLVFAFFFLVMVVVCVHACMRVCALPQFCLFKTCSKHILRHNPDSHSVSPSTVNAYQTPHGISLTHFKNKCQSGKVNRDHIFHLIMRLSLLGNHQCVKDRRVRFRRVVPPCEWENYRMTDED